MGQDGHAVKWQYYAGSQILQASEHGQNSDWALWRQILFWGGAYNVNSIEIYVLHVDHVLSGGSM